MHASRESFQWSNRCVSVRHESVTDIKEEWLSVCDHLSQTPGMEHPYNIILRKGAVAAHDFTHGRQKAKQSTFNDVPIFYGRY